MNKEVHIVIKRKFIVAWIVSYVCMMVMAIASIQWANYIDKRSNQRWCGIVNLFNETYVESPPPTEIGQILQIEFIKLQRDFKCK
jgi:hypothetical protein